MMEIQHGAPVYVKIDEYKDILDIVNLVKGKLNEARKTLDKINKLKNEEDSELNLWHSELDEIEKKVEYIDQTLFEPSNL
jgi:predicted nuclease with TOPRIM domain|tara:strand:- start:624 stop:863 length:240 start_codon:yes stop_codon:yes gene_type:complete